ncbi:MAG: hypothetical protein JSS09_09225 [Verrucomicrobia bacterium]|nr:hypothetical protein [Verrucomicrobiota bacterium]
MEDLLTNESLRGMFKDSFELTHFAIEVGRRSVASGDISLKGILNWVRKHPTEQDLEELDREEPENNND